MWSVRVAPVVTDGNRNPQKMENKMNFKRVMILLLAALLLPGMALAQTTTRTNFTVTKYFDDGNTDAEVTVHIQCFTGLPQNQSQTLPDSNGDYVVNFIVTSFDQDELDCSIWEESVAGYHAEYSADTDVAGSTTDSDACHFEDIGNSNYPEETDQNQCDIYNYPEPVEVTVTKDWEVEGSGGDALDPAYSLVLWCDGEISGGEGCKDTKSGDYGDICESNPGKWYKVLTETGTGDTSDEDYTADVVPYWDGGTDCWVDEEVYDDAVEVENGCDDINVSHGQGDSCLITNTVFFEGIPTLSQYGMAIMALLMLGVGFVGFRRFV